MRQPVSLERLCGGQPTAVRRQAGRSLTSPPKKKQLRAIRRRQAQLLEVLLPAGLLLGDTRSVGQTRRIRIRLREHCLRCAARLRPRLPNPSIFSVANKTCSAIGPQAPLCFATILCSTGAEIPPSRR